MNIHDWVTVGVSACGALWVAVLGLVGWLWRHSNRLTAVETYQRADKTAIASERRHNEVMMLDIRNRLMRIEDALRGNGGFK